MSEEDIETMKAIGWVITYCSIIYAILMAFVWMVLEALKGNWPSDLFES